MKQFLALIALIVLAACAGFLIAGCGSQGAVQVGSPPTVSAPGHSTTLITGSDVTTNGGASTDATTTSGPSQSVQPFGFQIWFARGERLVAERRTAEFTPRVATAALGALLAGPTAAEQAAGDATAIPTGTRLLGVSVAGRVATVDLSSEYESGAGELTMQLRLGQVVYTLTQFPTVRAVRFELDGEPVSVFSAAGIVLDHPVGRSDYKDLLPAIAVSAPTQGARFMSPVRVAGSADVFEANVTVEVLDAKGKLVGKRVTTATCGTGCRGTFSILVPFSSDVVQAGTIVVHDDDAAGTGTPPHVVRIPVVLLPSPE